MGSNSARRSGLRALAAAVGCLTAAIAGTADAALLWEDQFLIGGGAGQYALGSVAGQAGGTGTFLTGPWEGVNALDLTADNALVLGASLSKPGLIRAPAGGSLGDNDRPLATDPNITARVGRAFAQPWAGRTAPEGSFYFGFLANFGTSAPGTDPHHRVFEMWGGAWAGAGGGDNNRNLMLGYSNFAGVTPSAPHNMGMMVKDGAGSGQQLVKALTPNLPYASDGMTHCVVLKFELSNTASDRVSVFLDPMGLAEPGTPSAQFAGSDYTDGSLDLELDRMGNIVDFIFNGAGDTASRMDDLRIGTTFADVACMIPEPGTTALAAIGLAAIGFVRRRRP